MPVMLTYLEPPGLYVGKLRCLEEVISKVSVYSQMLRKNIRTSILLILSHQSRHLLLCIMYLYNCMDIKLISEENAIS